MWGDNPFDKSSGGGFMAGATDSPAQGDKQAKGRRFQNVIPVTIKQLLECKDDALVVEGVEAQTVTVVGLVLSVEPTTTKCSMTIDDQTGTIECLNYVGTDEQGEANKPTLLCEGAYGRVVGSLRRNKGVKYLLIFQSFPVTDLNELNCHILDVIQTQIALKRLRETKEQNALSGTQLGNTFSNSMIKPGLGGPTGAGGSNTAGGGVQGFEPNQNLIHRIIASCRDEEGMHREEIIAAIGNQMSMKEITDVLEFLSNEGHVFSTVDDDHYKATDSQYM